MYLIISLTFLTPSIISFTPLKKAGICRNNLVNVVQFLVNNLIYEVGIVHRKSNIKPFEKINTNYFFKCVN